MNRPRKTSVSRDELAPQADGSLLVRVNGVTYRPGYPQNLLSLGEKYPDGQLIPVKLEREPENPFDPRAIKVLIGDEHVGYIPKAVNQEIQEDLDRGVNYVCRVDEVQVSQKGGAEKPGLVINVKKVVDHG